MRRAVAIATAALGAFVLVPLGCAELIGAKFDSAEPLDGPDPGLLDGGTDRDPPIFVEVDGAAEGGAGPLPPGSLPGLQLWLQSDQGVELGEGDGGDGGTDGGDGGGRAGARVRAWNDRSGLRVVTQTVESRQPEFVDGRPAARPFVRFRRADGHCLDTDWLDGPTSGGITVFVVARGRPASMVTFGGATPLLSFPMERALLDAGTGFAFYVAGDLSPAAALEVPVSPPEWNVLSARYLPGGTQATYRAGVLAESYRTALGSLDGGGRLHLGSVQCADSFADADVGEIVVFGRAISEAEHAGVARYLLERWPQGRTASE
jgi:hypothetical protein